MSTSGQREGGRGRRIAVVLVPGVGEEAPTETSRAVADGLLAQADGYARGEADAIDVVVPGPPDRPRELYRADRQSLRRGRDEIDLVEMRWSDISRFPKGLLAFFTSLFGLGLQTMTVGLEASHRADDDDFAGEPGRQAPLRGGGSSSWRGCSARSWAWSSSRTRATPSPSSPAARPPARCSW